MTQLSHLPDDCLQMVLDLLPPTQLFGMLRLNKRLNSLAEDKIQKKIKAVALNKSNTLFSECTHLGDDNNGQQVLVLESLFKRKFGKKSFGKSVIRSLFLCVLSKCSGIKSLDVSCCKLPQDLIIEVVRRCPQLECIRLSPLVKKKKWSQALDLIGHQLVHLVKERDFNKQEDAWLMEAVAEKCANVQRVDCRVYSLTDDFVAALKKLPGNCWVALTCNHILIGTVFEDIIDELDIKELSLTPFGERLERLSSLKFAAVDDNDDWGGGVDFAGLKTLDLSRSLDSEECFDFLVGSNFPLLEEFRFFASGDLFVDHFEALFATMPLVKELTVFWRHPKQFKVLKRVRGALHKLVHVKTISLELASH